MKLAILNRDPNTHPGGDVLSARELAAALRTLDVEADVFETPGWTPADLAPYDWVYVKHVNFGWSWFNLTQTWAAGKPYVLQPMFYPRLDLGMDKQQITAALDGAAVVHVNSNREYDVIGATVGMPDGVKLLVAPNGTSENFHQQFAWRDREVVGTVSPRGYSDKNVGMVADHNPDELRFLCAVEWEYSRMPTFYRQCRVFVNASPSERCSRTIAEALCGGCRVLATKHNWGNEWYGDGLVTFDPEEDFSELIREAYYSDDWDYTPNEKAREWTWKRVARLLVDAIPS
jgi:hypothetical protein